MGFTNSNNAATVSISVTNTAPVANSDSFSTAYGTPVTITAGSLLGNDSDADGDALQVSNWTQPANGSLSPEWGWQPYLHAELGLLRGRTASPTTTATESPIVTVATVSIAVANPSHHEHRAGGQ